MTDDTPSTRLSMEDVEFAHSSAKYPNRNSYSSSDEDTEGYDRYQPWYKSERCSLRIFLGLLVVVFLLILPGIIFVSQLDYRRSWLDSTKLPNLFPDITNSTKSQHFMHGNNNTSDGNTTHIGNSGAKAIAKENFRRDPHDYILSMKWDFDAKPTVREYNWTITDVHINPNGVLRPMIVINGQFPGPLIECNEGDTIVVNVFNNATNATSFHWHGIFHQDANWMDGTVGVTQCPIPPGESFSYRFTPKDQWGTYWYHSHMGVQYSDGLFGPLVIHSKNEFKGQKGGKAEALYDTDQIVMVHDHHHELSYNYLPIYLAPDNENAEPVPDAGLINGRNKQNCSKVPEKYPCDSQDAELATIYLQRGKRNRLRFINVGVFAEFEVSVDQHPLSVVEVDGTSVVPNNSFHRVSVNVAQRYSVILNANETSSSTFNMRAKMITHCFAEPNKALDPEVLAIAQYNDGDIIAAGSKTQSSNTKETATLMAKPTSHGWPEANAVLCTDLNATLHLTPAKNDYSDAPNHYDVFHHVRANFEIGAYQLSRGFFNQSSWRADPRHPLLNAVVDALKTTDSTNGTSDGSGINTSSEMDGYLSKLFEKRKQFVVNLGKKGNVVDLLVDNYDDGNHPFHLHGHKFWVLAQGHGYFNESSHDLLRTWNLVQRDAVTVEQYGWILIRFIADNPGLWAFHCHNAWHSEAGLMMSFLSGSEEMKSWSLPEDLSGFCSAEGVSKGHFDSNSVIPPEWRIKLGIDPPPGADAKSGSHSLLSRSITILKRLIS